MNKLFLALFLILNSTLYGLSLSEVIIKALDKNPSLESIKYRISASQSRIKSSNQFANPMLTLADNNLDTDQAMSRSTITQQKKLPYFVKRDSLREIALSEEGVLSENLEQAKVSLVNEIKNQAYRVWELEELYKIIQ